MIADNFVIFKRKTVCYNTTLTKRINDIENMYRTPMYDPDSYQPYYSNNGFNHNYLFIIPQNNPDQIFPAYWGLVPEFQMKDIPLFWKKFNTLNARSEDIFESRSFKKSARSMRCLIFADGFFEPHHVAGKSQPYFCYIPGGTTIEDRKLFCYAGLYTSNGEGNYYTSLLTTEANEFFAKIHNKTKRMPLVLEQDLGKEWLLDLNKNQVKEIIHNGYTSERFDAHPVSSNLYKRTYYNNTSEIIQPVPPIESNTLFDK